MLDERVSRGFGIIHLPEPLRARLRAVARRRESHWVDLDARRSRGGLCIDRYRFWVVDDRSGRLVYGPRRTDGPRHAVALPPGRYRIFVEVGDVLGSADVASQEVTILPGVIVTESGALGSRWGTESSFTLPQSSGTIDLETLLGEASGATSDSPIWIQAFGAEGGHGGALDFWQGGSSGAGGFAMFVCNLDGFRTKFGTTTINYLLGNNGSHFDWGGGDGAASTVVAAADFPSYIDAPANVTLCSLSQLVVLAGGSGGGGASSSVDNGHDGGAGGTANSYHSLDAGVTGAGSGGNGGDAAGGGNGDTGGSGGGNGSAGQGGIGGWGGMASANGASWLNNHTATCGSYGNGGGSASGGGAGAGGYGGGGGAGNSDGRGCGGGGGGSYAAASTAYDAMASIVATSSGSATGVIKVIFNPTTS